ncbi:uncharacterized protein LOC142355894 [Convolutriloba macropyga]|uniref:uncharacterized protein LOC142355894 n=1 Tax=Convolutriloba macropyga TaxID=536237 RepID=UPI003F526A9F
MVSTKDDVSGPPTLLRPNKSGSGRGRSGRQGTAPRPPSEQPRQVVQVVSRPQASPQVRGGGKESHASVHSIATVPSKARNVKLVDRQWAFHSRQISKVCFMAASQGLAC